MTKTCPCGSVVEPKFCCDAIINGTKQAETPEQLMRSRYRAYSSGNLEYIVKTMSGEALKDFDVATAKLWAESITWLGLKIHKSYFDVNNADIGYIAFEVKFMDYANTIQTLSEISEFSRIENQWFYIDGKILTKSNYNKTSRNDLCSCGSGKKYKKCCL